MLLSDLLNALAQSPWGAPIGGPGLPQIPKSPTNVTAASPLGAINTASKPAEMMSALAQQQNVAGENKLRELQGQNLGAQMEMLRYRLAMMPQLQKLTQQMIGGGTGLTAASPDDNAPSAQPSEANAGGNTPADLVKKYESGGDYNAGYGGIDLSKAPLDEYGFPVWEGAAGPAGRTHAAGAYQFEPATWRQYASKLGIRDFSPASQDAVFRAAYLDQGFAPWAPYNAKLRAALASSPGNQGIAPAAMSGSSAPLAGAPAAALPGAPGALVTDSAGTYRMPTDYGSPTANAILLGHSSPAAADVPAAVTQAVITPSDADKTAQANAQAAQDRVKGQAAAQTAQGSDASPVAHKVANSTVQRFLDTGPTPVGAPVMSADDLAAGLRDRMQPGGQMAQALRQQLGGPQIDPRQMLAFGVTSRLAGMGDVAQPLEQYYYNSPAFKYQQALAENRAKYAGPDADVGLQQSLESAKARAKMLNTPINIRQGGSAWIVMPDGTARLLAQSPKLPVGAQLGPNGEAQEVPGALPAITNAAVAQAAGPATFQPQEFYGPYGQGFLGTRRMLPGAAQGSMPQLAPNGGNLAIGGALPAPAAAMPAEVATSRPEAAAPTFPVQTPAGAKDISQVTVGDLFPGGQGIPRPPAPPSGLGYGKPDAATEKMQEDDATRLEGYNKEAGENQKIYQDLSHLRDVLHQSLSTSKLTPLWADLANVAHGLGADALIPKSIDPANAAEFDKAATDLVFAAVKKLAGQVKVAEIIGYKQASPNLTIPRETNYNIMNDVLSTAKWQDARARLATEYWTQTGHAPLGAFDARFNQMAPLVDVTDTYKAAIKRLDPNARFPGENMPAATTPVAQAPVPPVTAVGPNGHRIIVENGRWVDAVTHQPLGQ